MQNNEAGRALRRCGCRRLYYTDREGNLFASRTSTVPTSCSCGTALSATTSSWTDCLLSHRNDFTTLATEYGHYRRKLAVYQPILFVHRFLTYLLRILLLAILFWGLVNLFPNAYSLLSDGCLSYATWLNVTLGPVWTGTAVGGFASAYLSGVHILLHLLENYATSADLFQWTVTLSCLIAFIWFIVEKFAESVAIDVDSAWNKCKISISNLATDLLVDLVRVGAVSPTNSIVDFWTFVDGCMCAGGLVAAIAGLSPGYYLSLQRSVHLFRLSLPGLCNLAPDLFDWLVQSSQTTIQVAKRFSQAARPLVPSLAYLAIPTSIGYYILSEILRSRNPPRRRTTDAEDLAVVRNRNQQVEESPLDPPIDLETLPANQLTVFSDAPAFPHVSKALNSIIRIGQTYHATGFRCGNNIITAGHCLTKNSGGLGAWCYDPVAKNYAWAPSEFLAKEKGVLPKDRIAILSLPNVPYFTGRQSLPLDVRGRSSGHCMVFCWNDSETDRTGAYAPSTSAYTIDGGSLKYRATVVPGSSGGPVISESGVIGVVNAECGFSNHGIPLTPEIMTFLTHGRAAPSSGVAGPLSSHQSIPSFMRIPRLASLWSPDIAGSILDTSGPTVQENMRKLRSSSTIGDWTWLEQWLEEENEEIRSRRSEREKNGDRRNKTAPPPNGGSPYVESLAPCAQYAQSSLCDVRITEEELARPGFGYGMAVFPN